MSRVRRPGKVGRLASVLARGLQRQALGLREPLAEPRAQAVDQSLLRLAHRLPRHALPIRDVLKRDRVLREEAFVEEGRGAREEEGMRPMRKMLTWSGNERIELE